MPEQSMNCPNTRQEAISALVYYNLHVQRGQFQKMANHQDM
jgi:hypothetical protein